MLRSAPLALVLLTSTPIACGDGQTPAKPDPSPPPTATPAEQGPWRFRPTLEQHLPNGAVAEPILELSLPREYTVIVLAAVLRTGDEIGLERWTFEQTAGEESLRLREGGERVLRLQPGTRHPQLGDLRRTLATPRAVLTRPIGLPGDDPNAVIDAVSAALTVMRDPKGDARARVEATATAVRGLDDAVVFERDAIWVLADVLVPKPSAIDVAIQSERRARATFEADGRTVTLELQRKTDGWAIASVDAPAPPAPPSDPTGGSETGPASGGLVEL